MAEHVSSQNAAIPASVIESSNPVPPPAPQKQKMIMTDNLRELLGQMLHANLVSMHMVLAPPGARGKGAALDQLCTFLNNHEHDFLRGKATTVPTLSGWIVDLKKVAEQEQAKRDDIETKGRGANEAETVAKHVTTWCDLMRDYDELHGKKAPPKVNSRYALPDHIVALGITLQKSDSALLPRHSSKEDARTGIEEREAAMARIKDAASKKRSVQETMADNTGGSASIDDRGSKAHLRPSSMKQQASNERDKMMSALAGYLTSESKSSDDERMAKKLELLKGYSALLMANPELKDVYLPLILGVQKQILAAQEEEARTNHVDSFSTPPSAAASGGSPATGGLGGSPATGGMGGSPAT